MIRKLRKQLTRRAAVALRPVDCALRTLLVLSMWHAPIPWIHSHDLTGPIVERVGSLSRHVDEFHADATHHGETEIGWHMHLVLPWCLSHRGPCPADLPDDEGHFPSGLKFGLVVPAAQPVSMGHAGLVAGEFLPLAAVCDLPHAQSARGALAASGPRNRVLHFLGTYGSSVSMGDLLSIRVC